jgi:tetrahydromethanopterin S-methyltransferase subunit D
MTIGWLWFLLALGAALMLAAAQQLAPTATAVWQAVFAAGFCLAIAAIAAYLIGGVRK